MKKLFIRIGLIYTVSLLNLVSSNVLANDTITKEFSWNQWHLVSVPCVDDTTKVWDVFSWLPANNWALFSYDGSAYTTLSIDDTFTSNRGYWFKYISEDPVSATVTCASPKNSKQTLPWNKFSLLGNQYGQKLPLNSIYVASTSLLNKKKELGLTSIFVYRNWKYVTLNQGNDSIDTWEWYWIRNSGPEELELTFEPYIEEAKIEKLLSNRILWTSYESFSWYDASAPYFWIYPMLWKGDDLYFGVWTSLPADQDGAAIAKYNANTKSLTYIESLNEQWIMTLVDMWEGIGIPWVDPCCGDLLSDEWEYGKFKNGWDWGNFYYLDPSNDSVTKHRNIPYVIHSWGAWYDNLKGTLYIATSDILESTDDIYSPTIDDWSWKIHSTTDKWVTWQEVADKTNWVGTWRTYDITGHNGNLYAQWKNVEGNKCWITMSKDEGETWTKIPWADVRCANRLYIVWNNLVVLSSNASQFTLINLFNDQVTQKELPLGSSLSTYHPLATDPYGNAYIWTLQWTVLHTRDFNTWAELAKYDAESVSFNTIHYWESQEALVMWSWWESANIWKLDLQNSDRQWLPDILNK